MADLIPKPLPGSIRGPLRAEVAVRLMTAADIPFANRLTEIAGWNQTGADWAGYLEFEPEGCFVAEVGSHPVGTATTIRYCERFGWIGMVLVHPDSRRLGVGTTLLRHAITYVQRSGTACVKLDATPMGRKVYVPLGFKDEYEVSRYEGIAPAAAKDTAAGVTLLTGCELEQVIAFDAPIFGAERGTVLRSLSQRNPELCLVAETTGGIAGYLFAREGRNAVQLGPWLAADERTAAMLLGTFFAYVKGRRVFVDVPHPNEMGRALLERCGFKVQRGFVRMVLGENRHPGMPQCVFSTSGAEKG